MYGGVDGMVKRICPNEVTLSSYLSGCLNGMERVEVEKHLAGCGSCRTLIVETYEVTRKFDAARVKVLFLKWLKKNCWGTGALITFIASFIFRKYFLQFLTGAMLMGIKWIVEAKNTKLLITIHEAWKRNGEEADDKISSRFGR